MGLAELSSLTKKHAPADGTTPTAIPFLSLIRASKPTPLRSGILEPSICLVVEGDKRLLVGRDAHRYGAGSYCMSALEFPTAGKVVTAPYHAIRIVLGILFVDAEHVAKIDDVENIDAQVAQVVVHRTDQLARGRCGEHRSIRPAPRADLGDDDKVVWIGMKRFVDQLIGDVRTVVVAGVDVVHTGDDCLAQHRQRRGTILRRPEHIRARKLHRTKPQAPNVQIAQREPAGLLSAGHRHHQTFMPPSTTISMPVT
jgi:hypothetical protein